MNENANNGQASNCNSECAGCGNSMEKKTSVSVTGSIHVEVAPIESFADLALIGEKVLDIVQMETTELSTMLASSSGMAAEGALRLFRGQEHGQKLLVEGMGGALAAIAMLCADSGIDVDDLLEATRAVLNSKANKEIKNVVLDELRDRGLESL